MPLVSVIRSAPVFTFTSVKLVTAICAPLTGTDVGIVVGTGVNVGAGVKVEVGAAAGGFADAGAPTMPDVVVGTGVGDGTAAITTGFLLMSVKVTLTGCPAAPVPLSP